MVFQRHAARHDSFELGIVHHVAAGITGEGLFQHLFRNPVDASGQTAKSGSIHDRFLELVVGPSQYVSDVFFISKQKKQPSSQQVFTEVLFSFFQLKPIV